MKKIFSGIMLTLLAACPFTSCMDEWPVADTEDLLVTCPTDLGEVNFTIKEVKDEISPRLIIPIILFAFTLFPFVSIYTVLSCWLAICTRTATGRASSPFFN